MIKENLEKIRATLPKSVTLVAVSKTKPVSDLQEAYDAGQRIFGENHALEMRDKHEVLPRDIQWHFIGHLQTNKIKYIIPFVTLIHSIDSANLLEAVNKEAKKHDRVVDCLLQFHIEVAFPTRSDNGLIDGKQALALLVLGIVAIRDVDDRNKRPTRVTPTVARRERTAVGIRHIQEIVLDIRLQHIELAV